MLRAIDVPKPAAVERDDSYRSSFYANRQAYMQDGSAASTRQRIEADEKIRDNSRTSPTTRGKRRLKKVVKSRTADAADLFAVYMLTQGLESASD